MKAYKFITRISREGLIQIPYTPLFEKEVEIIIVPKLDKQEKKNSARDFVNKWAGFLNVDNPDDSKYDYLSEKYK